MDSRVASRYAQALFDVASQQNIVTAVSDDLNGIVGVMDHDARFKSLISNPSFNRENKLKLMEAVFADRVTALTMQLLRLLLEKRRETLLAEVAKQFETLRRNASNTLFAQVTSAAELSDAERTALVQKLEQSSGQRVEATFSLDADLIGGVRVQLGNTVLDGSVRGTLDRLKDRLLYDVLKQI